MSIEKLIAELTAQTEMVTASKLLLRGLTLEGRITQEEALASLSPAERVAVDCVMNGKNGLLSKDTGNVSLAFRPHGRLYLLPREEFEAHAQSFTLLGHAELTDGELREYRSCRDAMKQALELDREEICVYLSKHGFDNVSSELSNLFEHMAPLIYYVGERCFSNFYNVGKSGFALETTLTHAMQEVAEQREQASIECLQAAYCIHLLMRSGSYTRLEELNSTQLSCQSLERFFHAKQLLYQGLNELSGSLEQKADAVANMRENIGVTHRFTRLINGLNLRKSESILPLPPTYANALLAPITRSAHALATLQRWVDHGLPAQQLFSPLHFKQLLNDALLADEVKDSFASYLEYLIDCVVAEAVRSTRSDFGMTRSVRDFRRFVTALREGDIATACSWSQAEYFCHVTPGEKMRETCSPKSISMMLNAISARMRFNSWHYAPSYFDIASIPAGRGWFYAPRMADIAEWSDQHHAGHVHAAVRYSIRSPQPLCMGKTVLPGFIDLRLMRQSGDPYNQEDLVTAIAYTEVLQFIYQHLMNEVLERDSRFVFSFGDKKWFDKAYALQCAAA